MTSSPAVRRRSETAAMSASGGCGTVALHGTNVRAQTTCRSVTSAAGPGKAARGASAARWSSIHSRTDTNDLGGSVSPLAGSFYPRPATGRSSLLPEPPWHYSGDLLTVEYRTDPARVAELLPAPLAPAPDDPGAVALIWADWQSCGDDGAELLDPVRAQYAECFAVVRCSFAGQVYSRCVYIWVDTDFALVRGLHQGYPKKLGSIHPTRPHPFGRAAPRIGPGRPLAGTPAAADRRPAPAPVSLR